MQARSARILVLTGTCLSIIFFPFALFAHNRLYSKDLGRAAELERSLFEEFARPVETPSEVLAPGGATLMLANGRSPLRGRKHGEGPQLRL